MTNQINFPARAILLFLLLATSAGWFPMQQSGLALAATDMWFGTLHRFEKGTGTKEDPYLITSAEEFAFLLQDYDYNSGVCNRKYYRLTTDIDLHWSKWGFSSHTYDSRSFRAHFDGAGHKISNIMIRIRPSVEEKHVGLFGQLGGDDDFESVIENLEIDGLVYVTEPTESGKAPVFKYVMGGLVGQIYRNSRIENCVVRGMEVNLQDYDKLDASSRMRIGPLYGDAQERFGDRADGLLPHSVRIINSYGSVNYQQLLATDNPNIIRTTQEQGSLQNREHNGYKWYPTSKGGYSFAPCDVRIDTDPGSHDTQYTVSVCSIEKIDGYSFRWYQDNRQLPDTSATITIHPSGRPHGLCCEVYDRKGRLIGSAAAYTHPAYAELVITPQRITQNSYNLKSALRGNALGNLERDMIYSWRDVDDNFREVGTSSTLTGARPNHTYQLVAYHRAWKFYALSDRYSFHQPIFVCHNGISEADKWNYTTDGRTYPAGNDDNDGRSPETAVRTLRRAYQLLADRQQGGTMASNIIVIMGDYDEEVFNRYTDRNSRKKNAKWFAKGKPATILGKYANLRDGKLVFTQPSVTFEEETTLENITLRGADIDGKKHADDAIVYAQNNDLTFGYGIQMENYRSAECYHGLIEGSCAPHFSVFGGFLNLNQEEYQYKQQTLTFHSGYYARIIAGNRNTRHNYTSGNVAGTPRFPLRTRIVLDICNAINDYNNTFDVALVAAGQADGSCYALNTIDMLGTSRVGRIIGGNIGYGRDGVFKKNGTEQSRPSDSYFGQSKINMKGGILCELYGGGLGRSGKHLNPEHRDLIDSCAVYFYGQSEINISGGMVLNTIYAGGAGGVMGLESKNGELHTFDPHIPYMQADRNIAYGDYERAKGQMPQIYVGGDSLINLNHTSIRLNISGKAYFRGTVFGGGNSFSNELRTAQAISQSGSIFGDTHVNISGGRIDGYVYGGGRGSLCYFDNNDRTGYPTTGGRKNDRSYFERVAQIYGDTHVNLSGGEIRGMVFGGGEGTYYRAVSQTDETNQAGYIAAVYGNTYVTVEGDVTLHDFVFGGSNYGHILAPEGTTDKSLAGNTYVHINGGRLRNSIFAAGHGHLDTDHPKRSVINQVANDSHILIEGGEFQYVEGGSRYDKDTRYYGIFGSGRDASVVYGNTYVEVRHSLFSKDFMQKAGFADRQYDRTWDYRFALCGGGFGKRSDVYGDTHVVIDTENAEFPEIDPKIFESDNYLQLAQSSEQPNFLDVFGGGLTGDVWGSTHVTIKGKSFIRNIYGGGLIGSVGKRDYEINGDMYTFSDTIRHYTTGTKVSFLSGSFYRLYGGAMMGHVGGETEANIGSLTDSISNNRIYGYLVYGGNDVTGTIAGSNNPLYGTNINIYGGDIYSDVYGSGNGHFSFYSRPYPNGHVMLRNAALGRERPHVAAARINISGISPQYRARIRGGIYGGGNNTTVGCFTLDSLDRPEWNMRRETLIPNTGDVKINIGSHVNIEEVVMGSNGRHLLEYDYVPSWTPDGKTWYKGFINDADFLHYCRMIDISCVPQLTFNADRGFQNNYAIYNADGKIKEFETPGEMDAVDVTIGSFYGGGYRGSMTSDSVYVYTLPAGVTILDQVVGGCLNPKLFYAEKQGPHKGQTREWIGGFCPYLEPDSSRQRLVLNLFCRFPEIKPLLDKKGNPSYTGAKIFGGNFDRGIILGSTTINLHSNLLGEYREDYNYFEIAKLFNSECGQIYGAGKGMETETIGDVRVNLSGSVFNGQRMMPSALNVFGGGMSGHVVGSTLVTIDLQAPGSTASDAAKYSIWGGVYGGGRMGDILLASRQIEGLTAGQKGASAFVNVLSGHIENVFGGAHMGDIEGGTVVEIDDQATSHCHTIISRVFGGSDVSGRIGFVRHRPHGMNKATRLNTYVLVRESYKPDSTLSGFPFVGHLFGAGNGNYGTTGPDGRYASGKILTRNSEYINLAGLSRPDVDSTYVHIMGGTVWNLYGGANAAQVHDFSMIRVEMADTTVHAAFDRIHAPDCYEYGRNIYRTTHSREGWVFDETRMVSKYNIFRIFGGNNLTDLTIQPTWRLIRAKVGQIYGGSNKGDVLYYNEQGDRLSDQNASNQIIEPGITLPLDSWDLYIDNVYGGSRLGDVRASRITIDPATGKRDTTLVTFADNQYGVNINIAAGRFGRVFGGNDVSGTVYNGTRISMAGGEAYEIYGAGNGDYFYQEDPSVNEVTETWDEVGYRYIYRVPESKFYRFENVPAINKILSINDARPNVAKAYIEIAGGMREDMSRRTAYVPGAIYAGGRSATISGPNRTPGIIRMDIGDHCIINGLYMGSNGEPLTDIGYLRQLMKYNNIKSLAEHFPEATGLSDYSALDAYMDAATMHGLPDNFQFHRTHDETYIGSFFMGGNRASLSAHGSLYIVFPNSLRIFDKIVGGCNNTDFIYAADSDSPVLSHRGGILWDGIEEKPSITLDVYSQFLDRTMNMDSQYRSINYLPRRYPEDTEEDTSPRVYSGCYESGITEGEINCRIHE